MSNKLLVIDIKNDVLAAIVFTADAKAMEIVGYGVVAVNGRPLEEALTDLSQKVDFQDASCHVALAAESFFYRNLSLPFTDSKTISKILPLELEENTSVKIDRLLIDAIIARDDTHGSQVVAAMIDREALAARLATLQSLGVDPQTVTVSGIATALQCIHTADLPPDFILLNIDLQRANLIQVRGGQITLIRPLIFDPGLQAGFQFDSENNTIKILRPENSEGSFRALAVAVRQTLQSVFLSDEQVVYLSGPVGSLDGAPERIKAGVGTLCRSCSRVDQTPAWQFGLQFSPPVDATWHPGIMGDAVNLGWQILKNWKSFNFRKEAFAVKRSFTGNKLVIMAIVLPLVSIALLSILYLWYDYTKLLKQQNELTARIQAIFKETLPEVTRIVDPIQQLQVKIRETNQGSTDKSGALPTIAILDILAEVSANIPEPLDVRLARFVVDDTGLRLKGTTDTFNTVDAIKKGLEQSLVFSSVEISAATLDPKSSKIRFELKLMMKGG
jgi:general secretion pathway protein L